MKPPVGRPRFVRLFFAADLSEAIKRDLEVLPLISSG